MNRLNPLYILMTLCVLTIASFVILGFESSTLKTQTEDIAYLEQNTKLYESLKSNWSKKQDVQRVLNLLKRNLKNERIVEVKLKKSIKLKLSSSNRSSLQTFVSKILNAKLLIKNLKINNRSVEVEVVF